MAHPSQVERSFSLLVWTKTGATSFRELAKDVGAAVNVGSALKVQFWSIVCFDDLVHHLLRGLHRLIGREEPQLAHGRTEQNDLRRVLDRRP